jgi:hypothetical protein
MKRRITTAICLSVVVLCAGYGAAMLLRQDETVSLTATYRETITGASGKVSEHRFVIIQKPHALVRINYSAKADGAECSVRILRTPTTTVLIVDELQAKSTMYHPQEVSGSSTQTQTSTQSRYKNAGTAVVFGYEAIILAGEDKASKIEKWIIPQLNDLMAKDRRYWKDSNGVVKGTTEQNLIDLVVGSTDPALFEVPANYVEMTPSQIQTALFRDVMQLPAEKWNPDMFRKADDIYQSSQFYRR